jgi:predicted transcriptional regulator
MKYVSGAKSVKQYREDENLPEAKKGMKNCGCKHPKSKYKYGTGALAIPEGSAIVTANKGKNKQALMAYKKGNYKLLNNIIEDMPEDNVDKKQEGAKEVSMFDLSNFTKPTPGFYRATRQGKGYGKYKAPDDETQKQREYEYEKNPKAFEKKYGKIATSLQKERMEAFKAGKEDFTWSDDKQLYKSGLKIPAREAQNTNLLPNPNLPNGGLDLGKRENVDKKPDDKKNDTFATSKRGGDFLRNIPSLAEAMAKAAVLAPGVDGVAENYLNLKTPTYVSQLDRTLRENAVAANTAKENIRDVSGGSAGSYLSNVAAVTAKRFDANNAAVGADTEGRNANMNIGVGIKNDEAKINTDLRNQYAQQRAMNRGAYNNMLVSLGQSIDTAADASKLMSNQRGADNQRLAILKSMSDSGNYDITTNPDGTMSYSVKKAAKGVKKLKTYKRR